MLINTYLKFEMKRLSCRGYLFCLGLFFPVASHAVVNTFENDLVGWQQATKDIVTLNFDSIPGSTVNPLTGNEFASFPGSPVIGTSPSSETNLVFVGDPSSQVNAPSPPNMLYPECDPSCEGIIRIDFDTPVLAVGATFLDVEADFATTGFSITLESATPEYSFSGPQGQASVSFLGIVSDEPFNSIEIHVSTGSNIDGVLIDDFKYELSSTSGVQVPTLTNIHIIILSLVLTFLGYRKLPLTSA